MAVVEHHHPGIDMPEYVGDESGLSAPDTNQASEICRIDGGAGLGDEHQIGPLVRPRAEAASLDVLVCSMPIERFDEFRRN